MGAGPGVGARLAVGRGVVRRPAERPDVHAVRAELALQRAWAARGAAYADQTGEQQMRAFFTGLDQAQRLAESAVELAPEDPSPVGHAGADGPRPAGVPGGVRAPACRNCSRRARITCRVRSPCCRRCARSGWARPSHVRRGARAGRGGAGWLGRLLLPVMAHVEHTCTWRPAAAARRRGPAHDRGRDAHRAARGCVPGGRPGRTDSAAGARMFGTTWWRSVLAGRRPGRRPPAPGGDRAGAARSSRGCTRASPARSWASPAAGQACRGGAGVAAAEHACRGYPEPFSPG